MADENVGEAWYEARLSEDQLAVDLRRTNDELRKAGQAGERLWATPMERATGRVGKEVHELGIELNQLSSRSPTEVAEALAKAEREANQALDAMRKLAREDLPPQEAQRYADAVNEIQTEAQQSAAELRELQRADPKFDTPELQHTAQLLDKIGDEAGETAGQFQRMASGDTALEGVARGARHAARDIEGVQTRTQRFSSALGSLKTAVIGLGVAFGLREAVGQMNAAVQSASNLAESTSKAQVVFGDFGQEAIAWGKDSATAMGSSNAAALEALGTYGNLFQAFGVGRPQALEMSKALVQLAADLASFNNTSVDEAIEALRSGVSGETEPLKRYGIAISDARMRTELLSQGVTKLGTTLTPLQKSQAAYALILKDSTLAQGDFARTSSGLANQQRILAAEAENVSAEVGEKLYPLWKQFIGFMRDPGLPIIKAVIDAVADWAEGIGKFVDNVSDDIRFLQIYFGDLGADIEEHANEIGADVGEMKDKVLFAMNELGLGIDEARQYADESLAGIPHSMTTAGREALAAWKQSDFAQLPTVTGQTVDAAAATAAAEAAAIPAEIVAKLEAGDISVKEAAEQLAEHMPASMVDAKLRAVETARALPGDIAQAILEGRDQVVAAATGLGTAATDPLVNQARIDETRAQMQEIVDAVAEGGGKWTAQQQADYEKAQILLAGYLLRADPKSKEAMGLLAKYAKSEDPATQDAYDKLVSAIEERAFVMQHDVEEKSAATGEALPDALARERAAAEREAYLHFLATREPAQRMKDDILDFADETARATREALDAEKVRTGIAAENVALRVRSPLAHLKDDSYWWGRNVTAGVAAGLEDAAAMAWLTKASRNVASATAKAITINSEPPDHSSALYGITKWGGNIVRTIADGMWDDLPIGEAASRALAQALRPTLEPAGVGAGGLALGGLGSAGNPPGTVINERHLHIEAIQGYPILENEADLLRTAQDAMWFDEMSLAGG